jgi:hypothetical protein
MRFVVGRGVGGAVHKSAGTSPGGVSDPRGSIEDMSRRQWDMSNDTCVNHNMSVPGACQTLGVVFGAAGTNILAIMTSA